MMTAAVAAVVVDAAAVTNGIRRTDKKGAGQVVIDLSGTIVLEHCYMLELSPRFLLPRHPHVEAE